MRRVPGIVGHDPEVSSSVAVTETADACFVIASHLTTRSRIGPRGYELTSLAGNCSLKTKLVSAMSPLDATPPLSRWRRSADRSSESWHMFAQAIGEYGNLGSIFTNVQSMAYSVRWWLESLSPAAWVALAVCLLVMFLWSRR